jgi:hypothetical protein
MAAIDLMPDEELLEFERQLRIGMELVVGCLESSKNHFTFVVTEKRKYEHIFGKRWSEVVL